MFWIRQRVSERLSYVPGPHVYNRARPGPGLTSEPLFLTGKPVAPERAEESWQWVAHQNHYHQEIAIKQVRERVQSTGTFCFNKRFQ